MTLEKTSTYVARPVNQQGYADYSAEENAVWNELITRQVPILQGRACQEYLDGLKSLDLPTDHVPQCPEISAVLREKTGWELQPVPALIPHEYFFELLSKRKFPAATFIRRREELNYLQEPDIFHEMFGHCPLLTNHAFADFTHMYGKLGLSASNEDREMLARLYWFTIEFGLIRSPQGVRAYGGGILSSMGETPYSTDSDVPLRKPFDVLDVLRTPYRIDIMQPIYFVIENSDVLFKVLEMNLFALIKEARTLGMHKPLFKETAN